MSSVRRGSALVAGPILALLVASSVAAACPSPRHARGTFVDASGATIGSVRLTEDRHGDVHVNVHVRGVTAGLHGIHIHAVGSCATTATFADGAGGHYNPLGHEHGLGNPNGPHAGDLPNLVVNARGGVASTPPRTGSRCPTVRPRCSTRTVPPSSSTPTRTTRSRTSATAAAGRGSPAPSSSSAECRVSLDPEEVSP